MSTSVKAALNVFYSVPMTILISAGMLACVQAVGLYFACFAYSDIVVARGLRVIVLLTAAVMLVYWPFGTYLSFYVVNGSNNLFLLFTTPAFIQFLFGVLFACYTDILPVFTDDDDDEGGPRSSRVLK